MPLLEIIKGEKTSDETLYRALDLAKQIKKTPIVVNDSRGFFTSRVIGTFINEGVGMLLEGVPAASIEQASSQAGYPAPGAAAQRRAQPQPRAQDPRRDQGRDRGRRRRVRGSRVLRRSSTACSTQGRGGKLAGAGFYDYEDGKRAGLWKGLKELFPRDRGPVERSRCKDLEERMLFIESIEAVKCLDEGVIETAADANIGSILGIGFPGWTGGVLQYIDGYEGPAGSGPAGFVARARELAEQVRRALRAAGLAGREGRARRDVQRRRSRARGGLNGLAGDWGRARRGARPPQLSRPRPGQAAPQRTAARAGAAGQQAFLGVPWYSAGTKPGSSRARERSTSAM